MEGAAGSVDAPEGAMVETTRRTVGKTVQNVNINENNCCLEVAFPLEIIPEFNDATIRRKGRKGVSAKGPQRLRRIHPLRSTLPLETLLLKNVLSVSAITGGDG